MNKKIVYDMIESITIKVVLLLLKISGGFQAKLVTILIEQGFDKVIIPIMNYLYREGRLYIDVRSGKRQVIKLRSAIEGGNSVEIDGAIDDILDS